MQRLSDASVARGDARRRVIDPIHSCTLPPISCALKALECLAHRRQALFANESVPAKAAGTARLSRNFGGTIVMSPSENHFTISWGVISPDALGPSC